MYTLSKGTVPLKRQVASYEDVRVSGSKAPSVLNLDSRWRRVVSFTAEEEPRYLLKGPRAGIGHSGEEKIPAPAGDQASAVQPVASQFTD